MFDEVSLRLSLGCRLLPGQLVAGQFGPKSSSSLVGISHTLDKLLVHPLPANSNETLVGEPFYISPRDVIHSVAVKSSSKGSLEVTGTADLLVIGCASTIIIYDVYQRISLASISLPTGINAIAANLSLSRPQSVGESLEELLVCAGPQKLYTLKVETAGSTGSGDRPASVDLELVSERSTGDTVGCLDAGNLSQRRMDFVLAGGCSLETNFAIRLHQLDAFEQNLSPAQLTIEETSRVNCICAIETAVAASQPGEEPSGGESERNCFAYGLENGFIGVFRLVAGASGLAEERLWRHRSKATPQCMLMFDADGNGFDELLVGYANGRLEARAVFTGQLLAATRLFKADSLASLALAGYSVNRPLLLACSTSGQLVGFKPNLSKPRALLQGYSLPAGAATLRASEEYSSSLFEPAPAPDAGGTNQRTIEQQQPEQQEQSIFGSGKRADPADLHIELGTDDTRPAKCEARQNGQLLERINLLRCEQLEPSQKARHIYNRNLSQASNLFPSDLGVHHHWDADELRLISRKLPGPFWREKQSLRLSVFVTTKTELVQLIKLEDESRNMIPSGHLFAKLRVDVGGPHRKSDGPEGSSPIAVVVLRCARNKPTRLELKLFCESQHQFAISNKQPTEARQLKLCRVYNKTIDVPKFAMFTFAKITQSQPAVAPANLISLKLQLRERGEALQVLSWLDENFLCFRFMLPPMEDRLNLRPTDNLNRSSLVDLEALMSRFAIQMNSQLSSDSGEFDFKFADISRGTSEKQSMEEVEEAAAVEVSSRNQNEPEGIVSGSTLRVAVANGALELEANSADLVADLVQSLVIDRLRLNPAEMARVGQVQASLAPLLGELESVSQSCSQLEESERRVQSELYESADYSKSLLQQLAISKDLNEFSTSKNLLNELGMMLNGTQNAVLVHSLNNKSRRQLSQHIAELKGKIGFLSGRQV